MLGNIVLIILGFILSILGADVLVRGASNIAKKFHIPEILIGLTIVGLGTSMPELIITISSAIKGHTDLIVGNAIGSNLCNLLFILGLISMIRPVKIDREIRKIHLPMAILATIIIIIFGSGITDGLKYVISRTEGIMLLILFVAYFSYPIILEIKNIIKSKKDNTRKKTRSDISIITSTIYIIIGVILLKYGGDFVVDNSVLIAERLNISQRIIGLTIVAIGTALPELITSIVAIIKQDSDLAIGNLIGSCMLNLWLILGVGAVISPLEFSADFNGNLILLAISTTLVWIFAFIGKKDVITRPKGVILFLIFCGYIIKLFIV